MKWQLLLVGLLLLSCVGSVGAVRENFQSWGSTSITYTANGGVPTVSIINTVASYGIISFLMVNPYGTYYIINKNPTPFTYAAADIINSGEYQNTIALFDSNMNKISALPWVSGHRNEVKIIGGTPTLFVDGVQTSTGSIVSVNPSYIGFGGYADSRGGGVYIDNILIGESDTHVVGALPSNWTIQRDLINPSATGVYAYNSTSSSWVLKNSQYFYIDADTDSTDAVYTENFDIINYQTGLTVNTTVIDSTVPRHQLQYDLNQFLSTPVGLYSQLPDGMYVARFRGYTDSQAYFWVISSGASVSWDKTTYATGDPATITYAISNSYWQTSTYSYKVAVMNTAGTYIKNTSINSQSGTVPIASLTSTTYPAGAYYAEVIAHDSTGDHIMGYAAMEVTDYVYLSGYVMDETGAVLSGAMVNVSQTGTNVSYISSVNGTWGNNTQYWLTGSVITTTTNKAGYTPDVRSFTPINAGSIALNITLFSTSPSYSGAAIGGVIRDDQYGNPIVGATYHTLNGTDTTCTTNIAGVCINNNLVANALYNVSGSKTGYGNSTYYPVVAVGV